MSNTRVNTSDSRDTLEFTDQTIRELQKENEELKMKLVVAEVSDSVSGIWYKHYRKQLHLALDEMENLKKKLAESEKKRAKLWRMVQEYPIAG